MRFVELLMDGVWYGRELGARVVSGLWARGALSGPFAIYRRWEPSSLLPSGQVGMSTHAVWTWPAMRGAWLQGWGQWRSGW
jgi:hypothetical protein